MHLPDSAISPATSLAACAAMVPVWVVAARHTRASLSAREVPLLAIGAAFSFTVMLFNVPVPGGTTVHPIGGALLAILLGPWAAVLGMTVALALQALFFGDGGVLALGANCFTMAFAGPLAGWLVYRLALVIGPGHRYRSVAAGLGAYAGVNVSALLTAIILGIQPALAHDSAGYALYFPFDLRVTLPAILGPHLLFVGVAEAVVSVFAIRWLQSAGVASPCSVTSVATCRYGLAWLALAIMIAGAPLGLLARGEAWGEWGAKEIGRRAGYTPAAMLREESKGWKGFNLFPEYLGNHGPLGYVASGAAGVLFIGAAAWAVGKAVRPRSRKASPKSPAAAPASAAQQSLPAWLIASRPDSLSVRDSPRLCATSNYIQRTLAGFTESARDALLAEDWAARPGVLQRMHPRVKILTCLALLIATALAPGLYLLLTLQAAGFALAAVSRIPLVALARRVWLAAPLAAGFAAIPAALNVATPGEPLFPIWHEPEISVTRAGLRVAATLVIRTAAALTFAQLLAFTTRWNDLLRGLRALAVPAVFVATLQMTHRYLAMLMQSAADSFTARRSRTVGITAPREDRRFLGGTAGALFGRTLALTEEVHSAMISRGWRPDQPIAAGRNRRDRDNR